MKNSIRFILCAVFLFSSIFQIYAQDLNKKIDEVMNEFVKLDQFSGSVLVNRNRSLWWTSLDKQYLDIFYPNSNEEFVFNVKCKLINFKAQ